MASQGELKGLAGRNEENQAGLKMFSDMLKIVLITENEWLKGTFI